MQVRDLKAQYNVLKDEMDKAILVVVASSAYVMGPKVKGLELLEMKQTDVCCGGELTFAMNHENVSVGMASHKVRNAMNTGAEYIVSTDMSCLMNQKSYIDANGLPIQVIHIADVLANF